VRAGQGGHCRPRGEVRTVSYNIRLALVIIGAIVLCAAAAGTASSLTSDHGSGGGPMAGGLFAGVGLAAILVGMLRDR